MMSKAGEHLGDADIPSSYFENLSARALAKVTMLDTCSAWSYRSVREAAVHSFKKQLV